MQHSSIWNAVTDSRMSHNTSLNLFFNFLKIIILPLPSKSNESPWDPRTNSTLISAGINREFSLLSSPSISVTSTKRNEETDAQMLNARCNVFLNIDSNLTFLSFPWNIFLYYFKETLNLNFLKIFSEFF